jgi:hypothetical protein
MWNNAANKGFKDENLLYLEKFQRYVPIYKRFTDITKENIDTFSPPLNRKLISVESKHDNSFNKFKAKIYDTTTKETKLEDVFFKFSPLVDPIKYSTGKYEDIDKDIFVLPNIDNTDKVFDKILDVNNSAYVDCYFTYVTSKLRNMGFIHGVDFFGTHLGIQNNYKINVSDDFEFMCSSDYFMKHVGINFDVVNYDDMGILTKSSTSKFKDRLKIDESVNIEKLEDETLDISGKEDIKTVFLTPREEKKSSGPVMLNDLGDIELFEIKFTDEKINIDEDNSSDEEDSCDDNSSCSSATTNGSDIEDDEDEDEDEDEDYEDDDESEDESEPENIYLHVKKFPVMLICMENCNHTYDHYITQNSLTEDQWSSSLLQIIMILLTYQKIYNFTHNDLHTNNIMYIDTDQPYIYYKYDGKSYRVPTYGKIFKIIDFGRSIYTNDKMLFCSNSYDKGEDAYTQYNSEPFYNPEKKKVEPNMSFDLCRLGCSMFDFLIDDIDDLDEQVKNDPIVKLVVEWCKDDKGKNILYKSSGEERYPDFKLYKMIARTVHNHTPELQLKREIFSKYSVENEEIDGLGEKCIVVNIDKIIETMQN